MSFIGRRRDRPLSIEVFQVLEMKGGAENINQVDDLAQFSTSSTTYVLAKTIQITTPTPPAQITVLLYAIMVSIRLWNSGAYDTTCRIDLDDVMITEVPVTGTTPTYKDRSMPDRTAAGTYTVKLYLKVSAGTGYLDNARVLCGVGTSSVVDVKVVSIATVGQVKMSSVFAAKNWDGGGNIVSTLKPDESQGDFSTKTLNVTADGSLYSTNLTHDSFAYETADWYLRVGGYVRAAFLQFNDTKTTKFRWL